MFVDKPRVFGTATDADIVKTFSEKNILTMNSGSVVGMNSGSGGKDPMGLAASILYLSSIKTGESVTQMSIAKAAGVTEVTIRNRFKDLKSNLQLN